MTTPSISIQVTEDDGLEVITVDPIPTHEKMGRILRIQERRKKRKKNLKEKIAYLYDFLGVLIDYGDDPFVADDDAIETSLRELIDNLEYVISDLEVEFKEEDVKK